MQGLVSITRGIGDLALKPYGLSTKATVVHRDISIKDGCLLVASDGLFDGCDEDILYKILLGSSNTHEAAR